MGRRGNGEGSIQRPSLRRRWIRQYPLSPRPTTRPPKLFVVILRVLEAIRARPRLKDAYKATARIGERVRRLCIDGFISQDR